VHAISGRFRLTALVLATGIAAVALWYFTSRSTRVREPLRVGFEPNPPLQVRTAEGFAGLAVDTINEAAKRAGIRLRWVETGTSSEEAFQKGLVDIWPLMTDLPDRRKHLHFTRSWLKSDHMLLIRAGSTPPDARFTGRIAHFRMPIHIRFLRQDFPQAQLVSFNDSQDVVRAVCTGAVTAGFLEGRVALTAMQNKPPECASVTLRLKTLPNSTTQLGTASTFRAAAAADKLGSAIAGMFRDGTLAGIVTNYSYYSLDDTWATYDLLAEAQHARWIAWGACAMILVLTLTFWQAHALRQRKRSEARLRESEERFRNLADTAPVMICASGPDKSATFFNKGWLDFTGRTMEESLGRGWLDCVHPDDLGRCYSSYCSSFDARRECRVEYRLRRADGEYRSIMCTGVPRFTPEGVFLGYIATCSDVTDMKRAQEEAIASQKLESLGVLAGGIAHDFNNLLGSIVANSELVLADLSPGSPAHEGVESIKAVAERAAGIVRELLAYGGQENPAFEEVDLGLLVREMLDLLKVSIAKYASLKVDIGPGLPTVRANAAQLRQVVMNLITNASEALVPEGGQIVVTAERVRQTGASDGAGALAAAGDYVRLEVSDTGCGMSQEVQARIFEPFFTTKFAGRGLGLAAVQGIVRAHGGIISVQSAYRQGTRFQVLFPCGDQAAGGTRGTAAQPAQSTNGRPVTGAILVVEDESVLRTAVSTMLRKRGFHVVEAGDGSTAIELFRRSKSEIDVVLLDMTIPGRSSYDVISEVRQIQPDVKIILTTAYSREMAASAFESPEVKGFIRKPYQMCELVQLLQDVLVKMPRVTTSR
jgi:PAS domain S-box-containing protein